MPRPDIGRKMVPFRIEPELRAALDAEAAHLQISRSELMRLILRRHYGDLLSAEAA